jgi:hypothetical protein
MSVDTRGVILTGCKNAFLVGALTERALNRLIDFERRFSSPVGKPDSSADDLYKNVETQIIPGTGMLAFNFTFNGETRRLSMHFTCDCDHEDLAPESISMSLGMSGHGDLFMKTVLHALSILGAAHFDHDDCDKIALAPLDEYTPSVLNLIRLGYVNASSIDELTALFDQGKTFPSTRSFEEVIGAPEALIRELLNQADFKGRWAQIEQMARDQETPELTFRSDFHKESALVAA